MKKKLRLIFLLIASSFVCRTSSAQVPANDDCSGATVITTVPFGTSCSSSVNASTANATQSSPNPSCTSAENDDDIWYRFTATSASVIIRFGNVTNNATGSGAVAGYALYDTPCPSGAVNIFCNNLGSAGAGYKIFDSLIIGQDYYLRFWSSLTGTNTISFDFCVQDIPSPAANDDCDNASVITLQPFGTNCSSPISATTVGATQSLPNPSCANGYNNDDIWYSFVAVSNTIRISFSNARQALSSGNANVGYALYENNCPSSSSAFSCSNNIGGGSGNALIAGLTPGNTYYLSLFSFGINNYMTLDFCIQDVPSAPVNDECINATVIVPQSPGNSCTASIAATTVGATQSLPDPSCANSYNNDDIWYSFVATTNGIRINFSNARQALSSGNANVGYALYENNCPSSASAFSCSNNIGGGSGSELIGGLTPGNTYYLSLYSFGTNNYMTFDFCLINETLAANDECGNAIALTVTNGFCTSPVAGDLSNATTSPGFGSPACTSLSSSEDVWFSAIVPASGNVIVQTSAVNTAINELVMEAYSGSCGALTLITCDDNGNPDPAPSDLHPRITLAGRAAGEVIYFRVLGKGTINAGPFAICAWDPSVLPEVSPAGTCLAANPVTINSGNNNQYMWVPVFDNAGNIMAEIYADGNDLGTITTSLFVNTSGTVRSTNGKFYLDRNISIVPSNNGSAKVRMYFTNNEFNALQAADPSILSINSLNITKTDSACQAAFSGVGSAIVPDAAASYGADHYIEFSTPSFSNFYLNSANVVLPLKFVSFNANKNNNGIQLTWKVIKDNLIKDFEIEYGNDGNYFKSLDSINQNEFTDDENDSWIYKYVDNNQYDGNIFYRIRMNDLNGKYIYSEIIKINLFKSEGRVFSIYPNPSKGKFFIRSKNYGLNIYAKLFNATGHQVKDFGAIPLQNVIELHIDELLPGIYFLQVTDRANKKNYYEKLIKL